ncbi:MAG: 16S rRNA (cytosine(967)-C(5))-methyltransferase RsmB [Desulfobacterales bacterium]|nr:16S rRNA (cytosine(967)-C(5))-methyltransferase RsmB [Desulfobacteraceae bacterium]MBT7086336.1 16S rRNA (cytosine(967)-C(5))-methyltransferase RsmB [Desulfobacterales bacterium]MBT7696574.1 16S rRNA (cytosine(967)-C(5))-methyltransferase RsmB [Desulfobacterales bacterium]
MKENPRYSALYILNNLDKGKLTLDRILDDASKKTDCLSKKDRALFNALVYGVLRWRGRIDWVIVHFSKTPINKIDPEVLNILRLGIFQIIYLDRIPDSAAVDTSVEISKTFAPKWVVGFVNGLLRSASRKYKEIPSPDFGKEPVWSLTVTKSFPGWLIKRWVARFGPEETSHLCDAINTIPPITIRTNSLKTGRDELTELLKSDADSVYSTEVSPDGLKIYSSNVPVPEIKGFRDGFFQVQDEAAQIVTMILNPKPGEKVLDACAGLGVKTGHIAQNMKNHGEIIAMDVSEEKLLLLESEMNRLGILNVKTCVHDISTLPIDKNINGLFDRILVDAPCSGLGVLRRNPDAKWSIQKKDLNRYNERQVLFLTNLSKVLKPHGALVYSVCSMEFEENEKVIHTFLNNHPEFAIEKKPGGIPDGLGSLFSEDGFIKTYPHKNDMDGFFAVRLKRLK